jgi:hypothetical protein
MHFHLDEKESSPQMQIMAISTPHAPMLASLSMRLRRPRAGAGRATYGLSELVALSCKRLERRLLAFLLLLLLFFLHLIKAKRAKTTSD